MMKNSKKVMRIVSISAAAVCMLSGIRFAPLSNEEALAADTLTAFEITEEMKIGWNLGNTLDAHDSTKPNIGLNSETSWGQPKATKELITAVKERGFNTIRIPTTWYQHLDSENNIDPAWLARVHEVVDYAYSQDMYVILNLHHEEWVNRSDLGTAYDEMKPKLLKIWQQLADEFSEYDQRLIFESMNEPRAVGTDHEWWGPQQNEIDCINNLNADFVNLIRSDDSPYADTRLLMIPGYCASSDISMISKIAVPDDEFVAVSIHAYSPYNFTMNAAVEDHSTFTDAYALELTNILDGIRSTFIEKDIPVVIGEFSASNYGNTDARCEWADLYLTKTKEMGVPCVLWDNDARNNKDMAERHDWINRRSLEWYEDSNQVIETMMSVLADDTILWGGKKEGIKYDHEDISTGKILLDNPVELDSALSADGGNCTSVDATWTQLEGGDVAVEFTGDVPVIAVVDGDWLGWTEVKPYDVDDEKGIAYFSADHISSAWAGDLSEIQHLFVRTNTTTTVETIAIIGATNTDIDVPEDKTKKYPIDLTEADGSTTLYLEFEGTAGAETNGGVGYMGAEEWTNIEWSGNIGADGKLTVEVDISEIPAGTASAEAQIWWGADDVDMVGYSFKKEAETTTTSATTTTTTTTTTTGEPDEDILYGDANNNGEVEVADAVFILQGIADPGNKDFARDEEGEKAANCSNPDTTGIDSEDALAIQMFKVGAITSLPSVN